MKKIIFMLALSAMITAGASYAEAGPFKGWSPYKTTKKNKVKRSKQKRSVKIKSSKLHWKTRM